MKSRHQYLHFSCYFIFLLIVIVTIIVPAQAVCCAQQAQPPGDTLRPVCADTQHESGVDLAFDALMDLEENSDLSTFMKTFLEEGAETAVELWTSLDETTVATNSATQRVLRCSSPSKMFASKLNLHLFRDKTLYQTTTTGKKSSSP